MIWRHGGPCLHIEGNTHFASVLVLNWCENEFKPIYSFLKIYQPLHLGESDPTGTYYDIKMNHKGRTTPQISYLLHSSSFSSFWLSVSLFLSLSMARSLLSPPFTPPLLCLYLSSYSFSVAPSDGVILLLSALRLCPHLGGQQVARLTVSNKLRPHRDSLSLLSPTASWLVCA